MTSEIDAIVRYKQAEHGVLLAFNIPHLPMVEPIAKAVKDVKAVAIIQVARIEWTKFQAISPEAVADAFHRWADPKHLHLHLDHIPVVDEDDSWVDYMSLIRRGIDAGYESVMIDGSRLSLEENMRATAEVVNLAHGSGLPVEGEIGSVFGHEENPPTDYESLFTSKTGFTTPRDARNYARGSGCDWLSVSFGSIHGFVASALRDRDKPKARLDIEHLRGIVDKVSLPIVLHGGSGIPPELIRAAIRHGVVKINIGNTVRLAYERALGKNGNIDSGQLACYDAVRGILNDLDPRR